MREELVSLFLSAMIAFGAFILLAFVFLWRILCSVLL